MNDTEYLEKFEKSVHEALKKFLLGKDAIDQILPDAPDIEDKWEQVCLAYLPDGAREFQQFPTVSLGWMMFIGMATARLWDEDWEKHSKEPELYTMLRDAKGYDNLDDYVCLDILKLNEEQTEKTAALVGDTAALTYNLLMKENFEPGTPTAFNAYVRCLHQLYYFGAAVELKSMGYHMTEMPLNDLFTPLNPN